MKKFLVLLFMMTTSFALANGQAISQNGGAIQGTITDSTGAKLPGASVTISSPETGFSKTMTTDSAGVYSIGPLVPGMYKIDVTSPNFQHLSVTTEVRVGTVTPGSEQLTVGNVSETVEVNAGTVQVNTEQIGVAGVVTAQQIDSLPINGRNILDIAQIEPGVQLQSGQAFDPTKIGYSAIAVNGQSGRSTRILVDGQDISDETVGTVLYNVPEGAIGQFQLNRSTQDVSGEVTSTGQVLLATRSGTNRFHGNMFYNFQDARVGFAPVAGQYAPFQRNQFGGYVGGPILKDKLFFFGGAERIKQFDSSPVLATSGFYSAIYGAYPKIPDPFHDTFSIARLDYNAPHGFHLFARATYSNNAAFSNFGQAPYALYENQDNVPALVGGVDFTTGRFTHSVRFGYLKFINNIFAGANALGSSIYNPSMILGVPFETIGSIYSGAGNEDAPQKTYQSSKQFRYDGTWTHGAHTVKFGGEVSRILQGGFAAFYSTFLDDISTNTVHQLATCATTTPIGGFGVDGGGPNTCLDDPLYGYKSAEYVFGNGNGSFSERPAFGLPGGGDFSWRIAAYLGDTWKITPSFTMVAGLRWSTDTDRANQDLATPTCGEVDASLQFSGCDSTDPNTPLFDFYGPGEGLGKRTEQNYANFGPQAGFVYSPGNHHLAFRGGAGIYYENNLFNNASNARAQNSPAQFPGFTYGVITYTQTSLTLPGYTVGAHGVNASGVPCNVGTTTTDPGCISFPTIFAMSDAAATQLMAKTDALYKAASAVPQPNTSFIGFANGDALKANSAYAGPYKTPYSIQLNGGVQYQVAKGAVLTVDYIHNATLKVPLTIDTNHLGAARYLNVPAAQAAIAATTGGGSINSAIAGGATIADFANNGLDSSNAYLSGYPASAYGITPSTGAAFAGANPNVGAGSFILPIGKSAYDAFQVVLQQQKSHPFPGVRETNGQISYNFSRAVTNSGGGSEQFFAGYGAYNQDCVNCDIGRNDLDHSNTISMAGSMTIKYGLEIGLVGHFFSAPPSTLTLADVTNFGSASSAGAIYVTDVDGDGTVGDLLPGTRPGAYMHEIKGKDLLHVINNYNATQAGTLTPAGQALVSAGLFTQAQLVALGATKRPLIAPPATALQNAASRSFDASFKYPITYLKRFREGLVITPGCNIYNVTNMSNYGGFSGLADTATSTATLDAGTYLNGPNSQTVLDRERTLRGSGNGTFDQGGPRTTEFSLRIDF